MFWLDWILVIVPLLLVVFIGCKSQKYVKGVSDFLAASRCAGRYVVAVAGGEAAMGLISVIAIVEREYHCGFAFSFWSRLNTPMTMLFGLTGYCVYRFRETRAFTMGQFLEMRYNRPLRVFAAILQSISGVVNYALFPAVSARFLIYFLGLPPYFKFLGMNMDSAALLMVAFLGLALAIVMLGGQVTIMVTDCVQGILSYPMYVVIVGYIIYRFSWSETMAPTLLNRVPGESFMNPYDIQNLRDFNLAFVLIGMCSSILNRISWSSAVGYNAAARNAHEQKIGGLLGTWRSGLSTMMFTLLAISAITYMNHKNYAKEALDVRTQLAQTVIEDVGADKKFDAARAELIKEFKAMKPVYRGVEKPLSQKDNLDSIYFEMTRKKLENIEDGKRVAQTFKTIYGQMLVPIALREMFPIGVTGVFCALMIFAMVSTDTTYMHSWGSIILQDIIMPFIKRELSPAEHLKLLRVCIFGVGLFAFFFSLFFAQMDYILMFFQITGAIWMGGAGPVIVFGLYSKRGTAAGAFAALIAGSSIATSGFIFQKIWAQHMYPWFAAKGWVPAMDNFLRTVSAPLDPYIKWQMTPERFPINSQEMTFIAMFMAVSLYIIVSAITGRGKTFNLDKMLHRGKYAIESGFVKEKWSFRNAFSKIIGITSEYTLGDKILAWSVFGYSFVYNFIIIFLMVVVWNVIKPWPMEWWSHYFFITGILVVGIIGVVSTVWFTIGGIVDLRQLFIDLAKRDASAIDATDNGRVVKDKDDDVISPELEPND